MVKFSVDEPQAFLAYPFSMAGSPVVAELTKALRGHGVQISSQHPDVEAGAFTDQVAGMLRRADFVVADLTGKNPNVLFELGLALGLGKPVLLLSQESAKDIPFDLRARQVVVYRPEELGPVTRYVDLWLRDWIAAQRKTLATE